ncbi:OsmC family protein [Hydrotalea sp.]|uniref:OsmC family protein n=1 Tax=Hydrotalea sp. TaxID=2881279 RepID=UPI00262E6163|nr:OsmC family protein [Hydrotalea sp.]
MTSIVLYKGNLRTELTHLQSGTLIENDAPTDNQGKGERFSPTDLVATALGSCMITTMGIKANTMNIDLTGTKAEVTKIMKSDPRRIGKIITHILFPHSLHHLEEKQKQILENTARTCPVAKSLHSDLETDIQFTWE